MMNLFASFLLAFHIHLLEISNPPSLDHPVELIVWNVGQGQWATFSTNEACFHFDMGGEHADWKKISSECGSKNNFAFFSHWDVDHLSFAQSAPRHLKNFCVAAKPRGPCLSQKKLQIFSQLHLCSTDVPPWIKEIFDLPDSKTSHFSSNDYSRVFEINHWMIAQGDSPKKQERIWSRDIVASRSIRVIVLGHHGSRTSSSEEFLTSLPGLKMGISSARMARYGHPHQEVLDRLKDFGVACLRTEYWGNIHIEMPVSKKAQVNVPSSSEN